MMFNASHHHGMFEQVPSMSSSCSVCLLSRGRGTLRARAREARGCAVEEKMDGDPSRMPGIPACTICTIKCLESFHRGPVYKAKTHPKPWTSVWFSRDRTVAPRNRNHRCCCSGSTASSSSSGWHTRCTTRRSSGCKTVEPRGLQSAGSFLPISMVRGC